MNLDYLVLIVSIAVLFLWNRSEARNEIRNLENRIENKIDSLKDAVQKDMKEFHGRMCTLEERFLQLLNERNPKTDP